MRRAASITAAFIALQLILDVVLHFVRLHHKVGSGAVTLFNLVETLILGLLIVLWARERVTIALAAGALSGIVDVTIGLWLDRLVGEVPTGPQQQHPVAFAIAGLAILPVLVGIVSAAGALAGVGIRRFFLDKASARA